MKVKFIGAADTVTGSKHLVITDKGRQILLDCGLYQGMGRETDEMNRDLGFDASTIDAVILSHAHIDHSGSIPYLAKEGFKGKIYCTHASYDVCRILLLDSAHIHEGDVRFINKKRRRDGYPEISPLYSVEDAEHSLSLFEPVDFDTDVKINDEISFYLSANGHVIGSAAINITAVEKGDITKLSFTGDIGRYKDPLLKAPGVFQQADYIISEATYGDRLHESPENAEKKFLEIVQQTCVEKKGKLIIPAFSLGRTQEILFIFDKLMNKNLLPDIKVFVDSPLSTKATNIVRDHAESFNAELTAYIKKDPDPFGFPNLKYIQEKSESKKLNDYNEPCVIISASGMGDAGRIKHHIMNNVSDPNNTILITGYCSPRTLGANLVAGHDKVKIFGDEYVVRANVESILSLSAHADYEEILKFLDCQSTSRVKTVFLVHGESSAKASMREKLLEAGFKNVIIPEKGEVHDLEPYS